MIRALKQSGNTIVDDEQVEKISSKQRRNGNEAARHAFIARHAIERAAYFSSISRETRLSVSFVANYLETSVNTNCSRNGDNEWLRLPYITS